MEILTILILPIHWATSFHLSVSSSTPIINVWYFSVCRSFTSLVKFIPRYFILFDAIVNTIIFFNLFSDSLLSLYRNTTYSGVLILYLATLPNLLVLTFFWWVLQDFLYLTVWHWQIVMVLLLLFHTFYCIPFISFPCLIAVDGSSNTVQDPLTTKTRSSRGILWADTAKPRTPHIKARVSAAWKASIQETLVFWSMTKAEYKMISVSVYSWRMLNY